MRVSLQLLALGGLAVLSQPVLANDAEHQKGVMVDDRKDLRGDNASDYYPISALFYSDSACKTLALNITGNGVKVGASEVYFSHTMTSSPSSVQADRLSSFVYPLRDGDTVDANYLASGDVNKLFFFRRGAYSSSETVTPPFSMFRSVCSTATATFSMAVDDVFIYSYKYLFV